MFELFCRIGRKGGINKVGFWHVSIVEANFERIMKGDQRG